MNLYHVLDETRPMFVIAENYNNALKQWTSFIANENGIDISSVDEPQGALLICESEDLIAENVICKKRRRKMP